MNNQLTQDQKEKLKLIMSDPVLWAKAFVVTNDPITKKQGPWIARDYQEEILRNRDLRKVYRMGRRLGKTECTIIDGLWQCFTHKNYRVLYITPYENQVELIFNRMKEIVNDSPLIKKEVVRMKSSPYTMQLSNGSMILGFTTGASSNAGAASIRGQRADWIFLDELDYMGSEDYSTISSIASERADIGITASSTPTGKRGIFWQMCTNPALKYTAWHFPSHRSPFFTKEIDDMEKASKTQQQYEHEILAEFGTEEAGVFDKDKVDLATKMEFYTYDKLTDSQMRQFSEYGEPKFLDYDIDKPMPYNPFVCTGVDWDAIGASSSIIVLEYDIKIRKFRVIKRIEVPRSEYTIDNAVQWVIRVNEIYKPSWIYCDRGYGDYQIERLHIYGDMHPSTGLKHKVVGVHFKNTLNIIDPVTKEVQKEPLKPFMVNQLVISFDREKIILSPFDETLYKQLIDYTVERISTNGQPIYTSINEHFVDALGLAHLAFVLKFPELTQAIKVPENSSRLEYVNSSLGTKKAEAALREITRPTINPWQKRNFQQAGKGENERRGDYQQWVKVPLKAALPRMKSYNNWGTRGKMLNNTNRTLW